MKSQICKIEGIVKRISKRVVKRDPEWAKSWQVEPIYTYTDISLKTKEIMPKNCDLRIKEATFQLRTGEKIPKLESCIKAKTKYSGDEFSSGQWLFEIQSCHKNF